MATVETLLTAEEYAQLPDNGQRNELVRGRIVRVNMPYPRHGKICLKVGRLVGNYVEEHDLGHVVSNDSGVITEHDPDTVRGPDIAFYSYSRVPRGDFPDGYLPVVPELVFEVRSPTDRWSAILARVAEYLEVGIKVVCVLDPQTQTARLYQAEQPEQAFAAEDELAIPSVLGDWRVRVGRFFE
jgi:Uma2 family endonuclease